MRRFTTLLAVVCLLAGVTMVSAQEEEKSKMPSGMYFMEYVEEVHPAHMMEYQEGTKAWIKAIKEAGIDITFYTSVHLNEYSYLMPFSDFSQINQLAMKWSQAAELLRDSEWGKKRQAAIKSSIYSIWMSQPALSHWPDNKPPASPETPFMEIFWIKTSHSEEMALRNVLKEWKEWQSGEEWSSGWETYRNIIGYEGPTYVVVSFSKSPSAYFANQEEVWANHREKMMEMQMKAGKHMTDMDVQYVWMRPDLSLVKMPEKSMEEQAEAK